MCSAACWKIFFFQVIKRGFLTSIKMQITEKITHFNLLGSSEQSYTWTIIVFSRKVKIYQYQLSNLNKGGVTFCGNVVSLSFMLKSRCWQAGCQGWWESSVAWNKFPPFQKLLHFAQHSHRILFFLPFFPPLTYHVYVITLISINCSCFYNFLAGKCFIITSAALWISRIAAISA